MTLKVYRATNKAKCLVCNTVIESKSRHDFVTCPCGNLHVDGGSDYLKRGFKNWNTVEELSQFVDISVLPGQIQFMLTDRFDPEKIYINLCAIREGQSVVLEGEFEGHTYRFVFEYDVDLKEGKLVGTWSNPLNKV
jgi:hypothetical protein